MATTYGLTPTGLVIKSLSVVRADLESAVRGVLGISLVLGDSSVLGIILGIIAERYAELWALMQAVYASQDSDSATGMSLDQLCKLTGTLRPGALSSQVTETFTGTNLTVVPSSTIVQTESTAQPFSTTEDGTLFSLSAWAISTPYAISDRVAANSNSYQCIVPGTSASTGTGPSGTTPGTDGTVTWMYLGNGTAAADIPMLALNSGRVAALSGDLTQIQTPIPGVANAINVLDAALGSPAYTDAQLRSLREEELASDGTATAPAIQSKLDALVGVAGTDVVAAKVYNNPTDVTDSKSIPPHALMAIVQYETPPTDPAADTAVSQVLYNQVPAGIATAPLSGDSFAKSATFTDSQGIMHTVYWLVAKPIATSVRVVLEYDATLYPSDGDTEVKTAIAGVQFSIGQPCYPSKLVSAIFSVPGVLNVYPVLIWGTSTVVDPIAAPTTWATSTAYSATTGARSTVITASGRSYICVQSGTSASSGAGPSGTGTAITDGTAVWCFLQNPVVTDYKSYVLLDSAWTTVVSSAI